jgi:hypothetical protein
MSGEIALIPASSRPRSNWSTVSLRTNSGRSRKLSTDSKPSAISFSAARCLSGDTGVKGSRPLPAWSRT